MRAENCGLQNYMNDSQQYSLACLEPCRSRSDVDCAGFSDQLSAAKQNYDGLIGGPEKTSSDTLIDVTGLDALQPETWKFNDAASHVSTYDYGVTGENGFDFPPNNGYLVSETNLQNIHDGIVSTCDKTKGLMVEEAAFDASCAAHLNESQRMSAGVKHELDHILSYDQMIPNDEPYRAETRKFGKRIDGNWRSGRTFISA